MLVRRIILGIVLLGVAALAYVGYKSWMARRAMMAGEVYSDTVDSVTTTLKQAAAAPSTPNSAAGQPAPAATNPAANHPTEAISLAEAVKQSLPEAAAAIAVKPSPTDSAVGTVPAGPSSVSSATDTIRPNPPNGTVYAGTGHYQVYRQGNLTWRINTDTGLACVLFATEQEWRKPQVYRHGCGSNASR